MSLAFNAEWDAQSLAQLTHLASRWDQEIDNLVYNLAQAFGEEGVAFIKPQVRGNGKWQPSTGATERGIDYELTFNSDGITVNFVGTHMSDDGRNIANMIDVGNFPEDDELWASDYGFKAFPISGRAGDVQWYFSVIHGMGHSSPEYPKHFSDNAVYELRDRTPNIAERHLQEFLDRIVI